MDAFPDLITPLSDISITYNLYKTVFPISNTILNVTANVYRITWFMVGTILDVVK